jgi:GntR family transcriptional regulator
MISRHPGALPLYSALESQLARSIATGEYPVGSQLPTEEQLIKRYAVSRTTVRKAIQNLSDRGLVAIRRGTGTFVAQPKLLQDLTELTGFVEDMEMLGRVPSARLVDRRVVAADTCVAHHLGISTGANVMRIQRVRLADGASMSFDETYLPLHLGEQIVTHDLEINPIFTLLEQRYDVPLAEADYTLEASTADPTVAFELGVPVGSPIFLIERTTYTVGNQPVDYEKLYYRGDLIRFKTRLARRKLASDP